MSKVKYTTRRERIKQFVQETLIDIADKASKEFDIHVTNRTHAELSRFGKVTGSEIFDVRFSLEQFLEKWWAANNINAKDAIEFYEKKNWRMIDELGWKYEAPNYKKIGRLLKSDYTDLEIQELWKFVDEKMTILDKHFEMTKYSNRIPLSDDSYSDLRAHIIGLGKEEFDKVLVAPKLAVQRAKAGDYEESFLYVFPLKVKK